MSAAVASAAKFASDAPQRSAALALIEQQLKLQPDDRRLAADRRRSRHSPPDGCVPAVASSQASGSAGTRMLVLDCNRTAATA